MVAFKNRGRSDSWRSEPRRSLIVLAALVAMAPDAAAAAGAWKQPGYAATRSSYNPRETTIDAGNVATLTERWRVAGVNALRSPVVAGGRVFVASGMEVVALALGDGAELWRKSIGADNECCSLFDPVLTPDGKVTVELGWIGGGGTAWFDPASGAFTYEQKFHTGRIDRAVRGADVFALDYSYGSGGPLAVVLWPYPGLVYFGGLAAIGVRSPAVRGNHAFVARGSTLQAFDLTSCPAPNGPPAFPYCSAAWTKALPDAIRTPVAFRDEVAVAAEDGSLQVYAAATGDLEWSAAIGAGVGESPAVARRRIFVPTDRGVIVAFDSRGCGGATCAAVTRFRLGSPATGQPVVAGKVLYAGTKDGHVVGFRAAGCGGPACEPLWDVDLGGGAIVAGPVVVDGTVIAGTADGQLVALGLPLPM